MKELKIIATVVVKVEHQEALDAALLKVVQGTRTESGNISYVLHRDICNPLKYVILEHWADQAAIDSHNASPHFLQFVADIEGKVESLDVSVVELLY